MGTESLTLRFPMGAKVPWSHFPRENREGQVCWAPLGLGDTEDGVGFPGQQVYGVGDGG